MNLLVALFLLCIGPSEFDVGGLEVISAISFLAVEEKQHLASFVPEVDSFEAVDAVPAQKERAPVVYYQTTRVGFFGRARSRGGLFGGRLRRAGGGVFRFIFRGGC